MQLGTNDLLVHDVEVLVVEWRQAREHLKQQRAERPPVDRQSIAAAMDHLRREVLRRAAESLREVGLGDALLAEAEVDEANVAELVEENVLRTTKSEHTARTE